MRQRLPASYLTRLLYFQQVLCLKLPIHYLIGCEKKRKFYVSTQFVDGITCFSTYK